MVVGLVATVGELAHPLSARAAIGDISTFASGLGGPTDVAADAAGNAYITDLSSHSIKKVDASGTITTFAGSGSAGNTGDGGPATSATLSDAEWIAVDAAGDVLIADGGNNNIREVNTGGTITTVAGTGAAGYTGDNGPATAAQLSNPDGIAVLAGGGFVVSDLNNNVVRKVDPSGTITTIAGTGAAGYTGDGGPATSATLNGPVEVATDAAGDLFIADYNNNVVRRVDASGIITTFAGNGTNGFAGDGGPAVNAQLSGPVGVLAVPGGQVFVTDSQNRRVREIDPTGRITTVAGGGGAFPGDGGPATAAALQYPYGLSTDPDNRADLLFVDHFGAAVREVATILPDLLYVTNSDPVSVAFGQTYAYSVTVTNPGGAGTATGVSLTDPLPAGLGFVSAVPSSGTCGFSSGNVSCALGQLAPGSTDTVTITVTAPTAPVPPVANTVSVSANELDPALGDNSAAATTVVNGADVSITASGSASPTLANSVLTYTLTIQNAGAAAATNVVAKDTLPQGITLKSVSTTQGTCATAGGVVTCQLGSLAAGGTATVTIGVVPPASVTFLTDSATVSADNPDTNPANNTATVNTSVVIGFGTNFVNPQNTPLNPGQQVFFKDGLAGGSDGNVWFNRLFPNRGEYGSMIGRITPAGAYQPAYSADGGFVQDMIEGPDGNVWFSETGFSADPGGQSVGRITPQGKVTLFPMCGSGNCSGRHLTVGPDGNIWFARSGGLGRIDIKTGAMTLFRTSHLPVDVAAGSDGNVWYTVGQSILGRMTPTGIDSEFSPGGFCGNGDLVTGPDKLLWIGSPCGSMVAFNVQGASPVRVASLPTAARPGDVESGKDAVYFGFSNNSTFLLGRATTAGVTYYGQPPHGAIAQNLTQSLDGNIWYSTGVFTAAGVRSAVGYITPPATNPGGPIIGTPPPSSSSNNGQPMADPSNGPLKTPKPPPVSGPTQCPDGIAPAAGTVINGDVLVNDNGFNCFFNQVTINGNVHITVDPVYGPGVFADLSFSTVNGSVTVDGGGQLHIIGSHITGSVTATGGSFVTVFSSKVDGSLTSNPSEYGMAMVCGSIVGGNFTDSGTTDTSFPSVIGDPNGPIPCAGNNIAGSMTLSGNSEQILVRGNNVSGGIVVTNNPSTAAFDFRNNTGGLSCTGNAVVPTGGGNKGAKSGQCAGL